MHGQDDLLKFKLGKKADLSDFERGMVVSARQAGLSIRKKKNYPEKRKYPVSGSSVGKNALLMPEVRGERLVPADRKATVTQISTRYNPRSAEEHL